MKIKVISGFEGKCDFAEPFLKTVGEYCNKFGYEFIPNHGGKGEVFKHRNGFWWGKLYLVENYLHDCDYVLWIDTDCICINFEKRIEDLLTSDFDILMTKEDVPESGVMLFKNSEWTHNFLKYWANYVNLKNRKTDWDLNNHEVLEMIVANEAEIVTHFKFLSNEDFTIKHTDFSDRTSETIFMHVPGSTVKDKEYFMNEYSKRWSFENDTYKSFINLDSRPDRLAHMANQLSRIGMKAERTHGLLPHEVNEPSHKTYVMQKRTPGAIGCHYSQVSIIETALSLGKSALVMEDDLIFCEDFNERMQIVENFLNTREWDVFWLGGTYHIPAEWHKLKDGKHVHPDLQMCECQFNSDHLETDNKYIRRALGIWSTYGYIVNYKSIPKILELLDMNVYRSMGIDWLFILLQPNLKTFCFNPGMVKQYDNRSDIGIDGSGKAAITHFSGFSHLGSHWYKDKL